MANMTFAGLVLFAVVVVLLVMIVCRYNGNNKKLLQYYPAPPSDAKPALPPAYAECDDGPVKGLNDIEGFGVPPVFGKKSTGADTRWLPDVYIQLDPTQVLPGQEHRKKFGHELATGTEWHRAVDHSNQNPSLIGHYLNTVDTARESFK